MKVYLIQGDLPYDISWVERIFSTREVAEKFLKYANRSEFGILEFEVEEEF